MQRQCALNSHHTGAVGHQGSQSLLHLAGAQNCPQNAETDLDVLPTAAGGRLLEPSQDFRGIMT